MQPVLGANMQGVRPAIGNGPLQALKGIPGFGFQARLNMVGKAGLGPDIVGDRLQHGTHIGLLLQGVTRKEKGP
jgi:hypothetical protein